MNEQRRHVISRLKWDTVFDQKERAVELQNRLSDWSGFLMHTAITDVCNKLCPPQQTWKIDLLELDLGKVDFHNLEKELSVKLRQQLNEKLRELIRYAHQQGRHIEILDEKKSAIEQISHFLQQGLLPWNHQSADGSINHILSAQLQSNPEALITMLKEMAFNAEQVRQRMAWQFNEANLIRIIGGLVPAAGDQIILFAEELTKIQQKETIVPSGSSTDFKKNLWSWILNYLLSERGTVFNRVQFMKSNILQMAAHYNMQYDQLFDLIEAAVSRFSTSSSLQPDFILTLQLLSNEHKSRKEKSCATLAIAPDSWQYMSLLFRERALRRSTGKRAELNALVILLSGQNKERFFGMVTSYGNAETFWLQLINDLSDETLKILFSSLTGSQSVILTTSILFLNQQIGGTQPNMNRNLLWYKGLMFLNTHRDSPISHTEFLHSLIDILAYAKKLSKTAVLDQLMAAEVPDVIKTLLHTGIHQIDKATDPDRQPLPLELGIPDQQEMNALLKGVIIRESDDFFAALKQQSLTDPQLLVLNQSLAFNTLLSGIVKLDTIRKPMLDIMEQFYPALGRISISGITAAELQLILFKKVLRAWTSGNWKLIGTQQIWQELIWEVCSKRPVSKTEFLKQMEAEKRQFPAAIRASLLLYIDLERSSLKSDQTMPGALLLSKQLHHPVPQQHSLSQGSVSVRNAGIVLINTYLPTLLTRLGLLIEQKKFANADAQLSAIHYLQYLVTGLDHTEESLLPFNKLLCGIPLSQPVKDCAGISAEQKALIDGLITAVIGHWPAIGKCSVDGFRGNWLVRDGLLKEKEKQWELTVEKRAYDLLIHKSPFSFSVIRYPWMEKPLFVNWAY